MTRVTGLNAWGKPRKRPLKEFLERRPKRTAPSPVRPNISFTAPKTTQAPKAAPTGPNAERPVCSAKTKAPTAIAKTNAPQSWPKLRPSLPRFHARMDPKGKTKAKSTIKGEKAASKNGAPTYNLRCQSISATKGQIVPTNTTKQLTASKRLFKTKAVSRLTSPKTPFDSSVEARAA